MDVSISPSTSVKAKFCNSLETWGVALLSKRSKPSSKFERQVDTYFLEIAYRWYTDTMTLFYRVRLNILACKNRINAHLRLCQ